jgi:LDH2 family malate/lactate/ureidoglycolate dehydrogenase
MEADQTISHIKPDDARRFATDLLIGNGVNKDHAEVVAKCLVEADLRGVDTHGT